eukprot:323610-Rhodomonas_salina.1
MGEAAGREREKEREKVRDSERAREKAREKEIAREKERKRGHCASEPMISDMSSASSRQREEERTKPAAK